MKHMNLTGDPWIPVLWADGHRSDVSLLTLFEQGGEIADLAVSPAERVALMRFLLCIVMRSLPLPETWPDWKKTTTDELASKAAAYLRQWHDVFNLYGEHPFLQVNGLEKENNATQDKLDFTLSSGNNHTLFDHGAKKEGRSHSDGWLARKLLVTQNFSTGGTIGPNSWNKIKTNDQTGNIAAPALEGSPLHVFCLGNTILESLRLNLIPKCELGTIELGVPVWEAMPNDPREAQQFRSTLLGRMTPISRAVHIAEDKSAVSYAVACNYAKLPEFIDPYLSNKLIKDKKQERPVYLGIQPEHHPWRELDSILALERHGAAITPPKNLQVKRYLPEDGFLRIWCGGVEVDKAKYVFSGEWVMSFSIQQVNSEECVAQLFTFIRNTELVSEKIKGAVRQYWKSLNEVRKGAFESTAGRERARTNAIREYWNRLNSAVTSFLAKEDIGDFSALYDQLYAIARQSFRDNIPSSSPWHIMASEKTMPLFLSDLGKIIKPYLSKGDN